MTFLWRHALWLLLLLPVVAGAYVAWLHRKHSGSVRFPTLLLLRQSMTLRDRVKPHVPAFLLFAGFAALVLAVARPVTLVNLPSGRGTIVLLMDVSLSMAASDVPPTRLEAARAAAKALVRAQPHDVRVGVVAFGAHADVVQPPTANREHVMAALDRLELQRYTAIGNGLIGALMTIVPMADIPQGYDIFGMGRAPEKAYRAASDGQPIEPKPHQAVAPGSDRSAAIILVSDGRGTMGVPAQKAAKLVAGFGIRVYTVGVGTLYGGVANVEGWPTIHAEFEEETLQQIADITRGEYFLARDAHRLTKIYETLGGRLVLERQPQEVTALFAALGMVLSIAAAGLSLWWRAQSPGG